MTVKWSDGNTNMHRQTEETMLYVGEDFVTMDYHTWYILMSSFFDVLRNQILIAETELDKDLAEAEYNKYERISNSVYREHIDLKRTI